MFPNSLFKMCYISIYNALYNINWNSVPADQYLVHHKVRLMSPTYNQQKLCSLTLHVTRKFTGCHPLHLQKTLHVNLMLMTDERQYILFISQLLYTRHTFFIKGGSSIHEYFTEKVEKLHTRLYMFIIYLCLKFSFCLV